MHFLNLGVNGLTRTPVQFEAKLKARPPISRTWCDRWHCGRDSLCTGTSGRGDIMTMTGWLPQGPVTCVLELKARLPSLEYVVSTSTSVVWDPLYDFRPQGYRYMSNTGLLSNVGYGTADGHTSICQAHLRNKLKDQCSTKSDQFQISPQPHQKYYITQYEDFGFS